MARSSTDSQLPVCPRRQRAHSPQEIWNGTLTRSPGVEGGDGVADVDHLGDALVAEGELASDGSDARGPAQVEVAGRDGERADDRLAVALDPRLADVPPLELPGLDEGQLLHRTEIERRNAWRSSATHQRTPTEERDERSRRPEQIQAGALREQRDRLLGPERDVHQLHAEAQPRAVSHTQGLMDISMEIMRRNGVDGRARSARSTTRSPTGVWPDMTEHGWDATSGRRSSSR